MPYRKPIFPKSIGISTNHLGQHFVRAVMPDGSNLRSPIFASIEDAKAYAAQSMREGIIAPKKRPVGRPRKKPVADAKPVPVIDHKPNQPFTNRIFSAPVREALDPLVPSHFQDLLSSVGQSKAWELRIARLEKLLTDMKAEGKSHTTHYKNLTKKLATARHAARWAVNV